MPSSDTLSGHFTPTALCVGPQAGPGWIQDHVSVPAQETEGYRLALCCSGISEPSKDGAHPLPAHPTNRSRPGWAPVPITQSLPWECGRGSSHGAASSGWDPLLGRVIRITLGKILIIVAPKPLPLAGAGLCPGSPNNQHHWRFSHQRWEARSPDPQLPLRREPLPGTQPGTRTHRTGRLEGAGVGLGGVREDNMEEREEGSKEGR